MAEKIFLGIDVGTSSVKVCAFTRAGDLVGKAQRQMHVVSVHPTWAEIDADNYWLAACDAAREATRSCGPVAAVGVSTTCPTMVAMDGDGNPLRPGILYLDRRSDRHLRDYAAAHRGPESYFARSGNRICPTSCWLANLAWMRDHEPEVREKVKKATLLSGFLVHRMTGELTLDWTQSSYSGAFDVRDPEKGWNRGMLADWGVDESIMPRPGRSYHAAGTVRPGAAEAMGVEPGAVVAFGAADTAAAAFALGIKEAGDVFEWSGTSGVITFCLDRTDFDDAFMNRCHIFPGRWLAHGAMSTMGGAFAWLKNKIFPGIVSVAELEQLAAESTPGANGLVFLPYLAGERSPIWDPEASGAWVGLRLDNTRADMVRAVFEGSAFGLRQIMERARSCWGWSPRSLTCVGEGARSKFWAGIKSDILGVDCTTAERPNATAWGAALLGAVAAGEFDGPLDPGINFIAPVKKSHSQAISKRTSQQRLAQAGERAKAYAKAFAVYDELYPTLSGIMHKLSEESD